MNNESTTIDFPFKHIPTQLLKPGMTVKPKQSSPKKIINVEISNGNIQVKYEGHQHFTPLEETYIELIGEDYIVTLNNEKERDAAYFLQWLNRSGGFYTYTFDLENKGAVFAPVGMPGSTHLSDLISEMQTTLANYHVPFIGPHVVLESEEDLVDYLEIPIRKGREPKLSVTVAKYENHSILDDESAEEKIDNKFSRPIKTLTLQAVHNELNTCEKQLVAVSQNQLSRRWDANVTITSDDIDHNRNIQAKRESPESAVMDLGRKMMRIGEALLERGFKIDL
jgi:hypothetical protein